MNPLDFDILKARVYAYRPQTMDQLKAKIISEVTKIGQESDLLRRITESVELRFYHVLLVIFQGKDSKLTKCLILRQSFFFFF